MSPVFFLFHCGLIALSFANSSVADPMNYCARNTFTGSKAGRLMQFTKEKVNQEYALHNLFKALHCCAKGYRSIEWHKDGKRYPWSLDTSSMIIYPQAANQTIYARHASKVDGGRYTCVLRNDTHQIEHQMELKVLDSSPEVPLATFSPCNQFADVGDSARLFCEAFVGKKDLPDLMISIKWYHISDDNPIADRKQEIVTREEEQIIGSYLHIPRITMNHYGRYLCRVEIGNSENHRLEMSAELINAFPIEASSRKILFNPYFLTTCAELATVLLLLVVLLSQRWWRQQIMNETVQLK